MQDGNKGGMRIVIKIEKRKVIRGERENLEAKKGEEGAMFCARADHRHLDRSSTFRRVVTTGVPVLFELLLTAVRLTGVVARHSKIFTHAKLRKHSFFTMALLFLSVAGYGFTVVCSLIFHRCRRVFRYCNSHQSVNKVIVPVETRNKDYVIFN